MYKWILAARYLHTKMIALFGVASVALCVAMVLVVLSVMGGFLDTVRERARGLHSEIVLESGTAQGMPYYAEFSDYLKKTLPDLVERTTPVIHTYGIFRIPATTRTKSLQVMGIRFDEYIKVNAFGSGLHYNRFYPGTTHLAPQSMPVAGFTEAGDLALPPKYEAAHAKWLESETDADAIALFEADPFHPVPYPDVVSLADAERVYAADYGEPRMEGPQHAGIIVGCDLLNYRQPNGDFFRYLARGTMVALTLVALSPRGTPLGEPASTWPLRYVDDSRTGIYEIDSFSVYVDFDMLQQRLAMDPQALSDGTFTTARTNQLMIDTYDSVDLNEARERIAAAWVSFLDQTRLTATRSDMGTMSLARVYTWEDLQRPFITAVEKEKVLVTFLFSLISMVAIVLVGCIFYMIVENKTRDIGVLKSLGASRAGVAFLFIIYAGCIGVVGASVGTGLGASVVWYINDIQDFLASLHPQLRVWSPDVYSFDKIPNVVKGADALWVASFAVLASVVGSLIPARLASKVWPVDALRHE